MTRPAIQAVVLMAAVIVLLSSIASATTPTPAVTSPPTTPTPTCFFPTRPPTPSVSFEVHPEAPKVGDVVQVTLVVNQGYNGPPSLQGYAASPIFADLHLASSTTLEMTAVEAGTGTVSVGFVYEVVAEICDVEPFYIYALWNGGGSVDITVLPRDTPTPTFTPTPTPTPTPPPSTCIGDCSAQNAVHITDLILMVNIALGSASTGACPGVEQWCNSGLGVTVDCIIEAVNNALEGCPGPTLTPSPTAIPVPTATCAFECVGGCCDFDGARQCYPLVHGSDAAQCIINDHGNVVGCCGGAICNASTGRCEAH